MQPKSRGQEDAGGRGRRKLLRMPGPLSLSPLQAVTHGSAIEQVMELTVTSPGPEQVSWKGGSQSS